MAIALVGSLGTVSSNTSPTYAQNTTAGNLLICWVRTRGSGNMTISGTGWTIAAGVPGPPPDNALIYYRANCGATESAPTLGGETVYNAMLGEFSGADTSAPLENNSGTAATSATSPVADSCGGTDVATGNLVIGCMYDLQSKASTCTTAISFTGGVATASGNANNDATSITTHYRFSYGLTTTNTGADTASGSDTSMNITLLAIAIASFKVASAPATRVQRSPGVDSGFGHFCKAHQAVRRWRHGAHGILVPEIQFVH